MTNMTIEAAQSQFDFTANTIEQMTLDTLRRTYKENDIYGARSKASTTIR